MKSTLHIILAIHITNRMENAKRFQEVMSKYGCYIKTRIGLHDASESYCSTNGVVLLELLGDREQAESMTKDLEEIEGIEVRPVIFDHADQNML